MKDIRSFTFKRTHCSVHFSFQKKSNDSLCGEEDVCICCAHCHGGLFHLHFHKNCKIVFNILFVLLYVGAFLHIALYCYYYGAINRANLPVILQHSFSNNDKFLYPRRLACCIFCGLLNLGVTSFVVSRSFGEGAASLSTPTLVIFSPTTW